MEIWQPLRRSQPSDQRLFSEAAEAAAGGEESHSEAVVLVLYCSLYDKVKLCLTGVDDAKKVFFFDECSAH